MASISPSTPPHNLSFSSSSSSSSSRSLRHAKRPSYPSYPSYPPPFSLCRCRSTNPSDTNNSNNNDDNNSSSSSWRWEDVVKSTMKRLESYFNSNRDYSPAKRIENNNIAATASFDRDIAIEKKEEWDWDRWKKHFEDIDEQERIVSVLKLQLAQAVRRGDFEDAARLKVAIAAAAANDAVGRAMSQLNKAVAEERYHEAAFLRDSAGAGLVGWWSGLSENAHDPYGLIIRITAEHGRYVARSYSPRQLATAAVGVPLFEIFFTMNKKGEYKQQAVYLKRKGLFHDPSTSTSNASGASSLLNPAGPTEDKGQLYIVSTEETGGGDDTEDIPDLGEGLPGFKGILQDMIPGVKVKVLKVTGPAKVDKDFITKVIEGIMDDEDDEKDIEFQSTEAEDEGSGEGGNDRDEMGNDADSGIIDNEEQNEISIKVVVEGVAQKLSGSAPAKDSIRVPAKLLKKGKSSFSFSIEKDVNQQDSKELASIDRKAKLQGQRSVDHVMFDLAKFIGRERIPLKVLKDVGELIDLTLSQSRNHQPLNGSTTFHRIKLSASPDPLNGLYIGAHGLYTSEVICLQRKYGQWQDERGAKEPLNLEFYEYVEAVKLTGDSYVPTGQVAFRAKVGKRYQLPHKGIIPEEFGVVARYKGQGRLAEPGFRNPRWVDGELVILDGKYIKGGPVVGFGYWAPEYHFLVFFNRLRLQ